MFLLDTNVISELRKASSGKADANVTKWAAATAVNDMFLSSVTILEAEHGVLLMERRDVAQGAILRQWLDNRVLPAFADRILPIDAEVARICARLHVPDPRSDRDALIAATALAHELTVVTRNTADFAPMDIPLLNPWGEA
jgi:predicted nucleic acid-binding protein